MCMSIDLIYSEFGTVVLAIIEMVEFTALAICGRKLSMISTMLLCVPVTRPNKPITIKIMLRATTQ